MSRSAATLVRLLPAPDAGPPDAQLLRAFAAARGEEAFGEIVRRHGPMVLAACRRVLGNHADADDAFQATFLVLARKAGTIRGANLAGWLYAVAVRTARGVRIMRDRRRKHEAVAANGRREPAGAPDSTAELAAVIDEELARLPDCHREVVVLCELRGLSRKEAAAEIGVPEGTLSSRLAAAKRKLAARLSARGLSAPAALAAVLAPASVSAALARSAVAATHGIAAPLAGAAASAVVKAMLFDQLRAATLAAGILLTVVCGGWAMSGTPGGPDPAPATSPRPREDPAARLVAQLGAPDFAAREAAQKSLRELGPKAEPALRAGLKSENPEVRNRAAALLTTIRADARDALARGFDPAKDAQPDHPVWTRFKTIAGDSRASRDLFAQIIANKDRLRRLDTAENGPEAAAGQYRAACVEVGRHYQSNMSVWFEIPVWPCDRADETAYLLLLGSYAGTASARPAGQDRDFQAFSDGEGRVPFARGLPLGLQGKMLEIGLEIRTKFRPDEVAATPGTDRVFARLLAAWLGRRELASDVVPPCLWLAARHGAKEVLPLARTVAADEFIHKREPPPQLYAAALAVVAAFGTPDDLPLFERHFKDDMVVARFEFSGANPVGAKTDGTGTAQVRDVAAGLALVLHGENPADHGFLMAGKRTKPGARPHASEYEPADFGFLNGDDTSRLAAHAKVKAFLARRPKAEGFDEQVKKAEAEVKTLGLVDVASARDGIDTTFPIRFDGKAGEVRVKAGSAVLVELPKPARVLTWTTGNNVPEGIGDKDGPEFSHVLCKWAADGKLTWVMYAAGEKPKQAEPPVKGAKFWPRFAKLVGDDAASRALFDLIVAKPKNLELLEKVTETPDSAGKVYHDRWQELNKAARIPIGVGQHQLEQAPLAEALGWVYLGTFPGAESSFHQSFSLDFLPQMPPAKTASDEWRDAVKDRTLSAPLRRLLGKWTALRGDYSGRAFGLQMALAYDIKDVLPAARDTLTAKVKDDPYPGNTARNRGLALLVVGKLGTKDDLPLLERYAKDGAECARFLNDPPTKPGEPRILLPRLPVEGQDATTQLRDVSAAMRLHLLGQKPEEFGFYWRWPNGPGAGKPTNLGGFYLNAIGFLRAADREAAHKKAAEWLDKQPGKEKEEPKPDPAVRKLVERLGAEEFADREAAEKELRKLGFRAEAALKDGLKSDSPEVRERAAKLLDAIRADLLGGKDSPVWAKFKAVAGDDADAWKLYLRATGTRARAEMLLAAVNDPKAAAASYAKECEEIATVVNHGRASGVAPPPKPPGFPDRDVTPDDLAALLFLGTLPRGGQGQTDEESSAVTSHVLHAALAAETKKPFARLYAAWAEPRPEYYSTVLNIGLSDGVADLAGVARKALALKDRPPWASLNGPALQFLGLHGTADDVALVMKFAGDKTECGKIEFSKIEGGTLGPWRPAEKNTDVVVQVRDVAVIAALRLRKKPASDFGFEQAIVQDGGPPPPAHWLAHLGFHHEADRDEAHQKAKAFFEKKPEPKE
jgi:RNA polymerase sigma factor (sigma-70 family)